MKIVKSIIAAVVFFVLGFIVRGDFLGQKPEAQNTPVNLVEEKIDEINNQSQMPWLDLPLQYFSKKNVLWGSVKNPKGDEITDYKQVALNNIAVYQSYPTQDITIRKFSLDARKLIQKSLEEILDEYQKYSEIYTDTRIRENFKTYGDLAANYLPDQYIVDLKRFDVDEDGQEEAIIVYNFTGAADAGSYQSDIVKNGNIIFSVKEDNAEIVPAETNNGFYIEWISDKFGTPRCCPEGKMRTRFVWEEDKFVPVYEQEVRFFKIGKDN